ncbi:TSUP family transporter [Microbulbifer taiwanensis]|uniref:Probable membrane transporter protein n=1 Tax=Microbulbifer taiwanensis TaxID=986746 RepID=A0ABW1YJP6_9GAMM|nr:TSUP family transporter [Microbulbifer taiwanensis]
MDLTISLLLIFFAVALLAGWVDTLAGGGGLITLPALLLAGVAPVNALATNKSQGVMGTLTSSITLFMKGHLRGRELIPLMAAAAVGAALGTWLVQRMETGWLNWVIPLLLLCVALYFWLTPNLGKTEARARQTEKQWALTWVPTLGFYDGVFGPGTGSFYAASGVAFRGQTLVDATIRAKLLNLTTNVASVALFAAGGKVLWTIGAVMMLGQVIGAYIGSHTILNGGARLIRPLVITMCVLMSISQIAQYFGWISLS